MALLPWDNWIYHLSEKRDEVNSLHSQAVNTQDIVQSDVLAFNTYLDQYKSLLAYNASLLLVSAFVTLSDQKLTDYRTEIKELPAKDTGSVPITTASAISELTGSLLLLKAVFNVGKLVKSGLFGDAAKTGENVEEEIVEDLADDSVDAGLEGGAEELGQDVGEGVSEEAAETAISGASLGTLAATGVGIFAAVGIDVIFGAINGATESSELDTQINNLKTALKKVQGFQTKIESSITTVKADSTKEITRFEKVVAALSVFAPPGFDYQFPADISSLPQVIAAQKQALTQYGVLVKMRNFYETYRQDNPTGTKAAFLSGFQMFAAADLPMATLTDYWNVLARYSDSIKAA